MTHGGFTGLGGRSCLLCCLCTTLSALFTSYATKHTLSLHTVLGCIRAAQANHHFVCLSMLVPLMAWGSGVIACKRLKDAWISIRVHYNQTLGFQETIVWESVKCVSVCEEHNAMRIYRIFTQGSPNTKCFRYHQAHCIPNDNCLVRVAPAGVCNVGLDMPALKILWLCVEKLYRLGPLEHWLGIPHRIKYSTGHSRQARGVVHVQPPFFVAKALLKRTHLRRSGSTARFPQNIYIGNNLWTVPNPK